MPISKTYRILDMYTYLLEGRTFTKSDLAFKYSIDERSVARDISDLREFIKEKHLEEGLAYELIFDKKARVYRLSHASASSFTNDEILALSKILLASRAFTKKKMKGLLKKFVKACSSSENIRFVEKMISNELFHYVEPAHGKDFLGKMWVLSNAIKEKRLVRVKYFRMQDKKVVERKLKPLAIMFSEYYFYLIAYISRESLDIDKVIPIIYRLDRIREMEVLDEKFELPYKDRFEEGIFRKRIQFMQGGDLERIKFIFRGESIESIRDRFPNAEIKEKGNGEYLVTASLYGRGAHMWLRAQGDRVELV